jgi:hypothetical protein
MDPPAVKRGLSVLWSIQTSSGVYPPSYSGSTRVSFSMSKVVREMELTTRVCLVLRLRMCCIIPPFTNIPLWCLSAGTLHFTLYVYVWKGAIYFQFLFSVCLKSVTILELVWNIFMFLTFILNTARVKLSLSIHMQMDDFCCNRIIIIGTPIFPRSYTDCHSITTVNVICLIARVVLNLWITCPNKEASWLLLPWNTCCLLLTRITLTE